MTPPAYKTAGVRQDGQLDLRLFWVRFACEGANLAVVPLGANIAKALRNPKFQRFLQGDAGSFDLSSFNRGNVKVFKKGRLEHQGIDAEALKKELLGPGDAAKFNVAKTPDGDVVLVPVRKGELPSLETPFKFDELRSLFPVNR